MRRAIKRGCGAASWIGQSRFQATEGVRMDTDQLIRGLAADNNQRERPVGSVLATALLITAPVSIVMFFTALGFRKDIATALHNPFFDLKFLVTITVAISAIAISIHLSRPEASLKGWMWLLLIPVGLLSFGIGGEMMMPQRTLDYAADWVQFEGVHDGDPVALAAAFDRRTSHVRTPICRPDP